MRVGGSCVSVLTPIGGRPDAHVKNRLRTRFYSNQSDPLGCLGLPTGDHWVRFHVEADSISYEVAVSTPSSTKKGRKPTGFVERWGGSVTRVDDANDAWLSHINDKHLG